MNLSGSVVHGSYVYKYQPVNEEDPVADGVRIYCSYDPGDGLGNIRLAERDVQIRKPAEVLASCFCAADKAYKTLQILGVKPPTPPFGTGTGVSEFMMEEGGFICKEIIQNRYVHELGQSENFYVTRSSTGATEVHWEKKDS